MPSRPAGLLTEAEPKRYNPRHPKRTLRYQTIAEHFEAWHELASEGQFDGAFEGAPGVVVPEATIEPRHFWSAA